MDLFTEISILTVDIGGNNVRLQLSNLNSANQKLID